ncbi:MAG: porin [Candidatus Acidiferrales bacterium]
MRNKILVVTGLLLMGAVAAWGQSTTPDTSTPATTPATTPAPAPAAQAPAATPAPTPAPDASAPAAQAPAAAPAAAPASPPTWSAGPIDFSGEIDGYYSWNSNHPGGVTGDTQDTYSEFNNNNLYNFNSKANQFDLNFAKIAMSHSPDPVGFELDFGFGRATQTFNSGEEPNGFQYVEQAYLELKPAKAKGFELDFGKFVTSAGAEVIESYNNWNYSRSLLFTWAIPYYHMGVRTSWPIGKKWTAGVQVVNGWNNVSTTLNSGKTLGFVAALTTSKATWYVNYYTGPANPGTNSGWLNLIDTTLLLTPTNAHWSKLNAYINYDYDRHGFGPADEPAVSWYGIALATHYQITGKWAFSDRFEWFNDANGFDMSGALPQPILDDGGAEVPQQVKEVTVTLEYKMLEGLLWRLEYRRDWSTYPMFLRGTFPEDIDDCNYATYYGCADYDYDDGSIARAPDTGAGLTNHVNPSLIPGPSTPGGEFPEALPATVGEGLYGFSKSQNTVTIGLIAFFGPKR